MLKINLPILDQSIEFNNGTVLKISDTKLYSRIVFLFSQYEEGAELKLFDSKQCVVKESELIVVTDVLGYELNSPSLLKSIYTTIEEQLNEKPEVKSELEFYATSIESIIRKEIVHHELDLVVDEITIQEMFKALGLKIDANNTSIYEKLLEIIDCFKFLPKKKLLVLINVTNYLIDEEIDELLKYIMLYNIDVILLEPEMSSYQHCLYLDSDFYLHDNRREL